VELLLVVELQHFKQVITEVLVVVAVVGLVLTLLELP
jgi:hypothetical protein